MGGCPRRFVTTMSPYALHDAPRSTRLLAFLARHLARVLPYCLPSFSCMLPRSSSANTRHEPALFLARLIWAARRERLRAPAESRLQLRQRVQGRAARLAATVAPNPRAVRSPVPRRSPGQRRRWPGSSVRWSIWASQRDLGNAAIGHCASVPYGGANGQARDARVCCL